MAGGRIKGITVVLDGDATGLSKALQSVNSSIKSTQSQLKDVEKLLKLDPGNTELLTQKQKLLTEAVSETKEKLETLKTAAEQANQALANGDISQEQYDALQREIIETEEELARLEEQANQSATALQKIASTGEKLQNVGDSISSVGTKLLPVTGAVVGLGTAVVQTTAEFDEGMSKVAAVSGATADELELLTAKAREMGAKTKFSASEASEALNYMAMAGWKTEDMLNGIEGVMYLAAAAGEDLGTTSDIVTDALTAFGLTAADSGHFADVLAAASSNANTNVSMMGETFKYAAPVAGALGYTVEDVAVAIGLMANSGIKSTQAGTALRTICTKLQGELTLAGEAFGEVTVQTANADGSMRELSDILADCRTAFSQMSESEAAAAAEALVGKNAMSGFLALMQAAPEDINKLTDAIDSCDGTAESMANTMQDNLSGQLTILKSALQELAISFGELLMPVLRDIVSHIQNVVDKLNGMGDGTKTLVIKIALLVAALGPALIIIGKVISAVGTIMTWAPKIAGVIAKLGPVLTTVKTALSGLWAVLMANPIILIIAAVAALVAAFIYLWNHCEGFREFWINLWDTIKNAAITAWTAVRDFFVSAWEGIKNVAVTVWEGISTFFSNVWERISGIFSEKLGFIWDIVSTEFQLLISLLTGDWEIVKQVLTDAWNNITTTCTTVWTGIRDFFIETWNTIYNFIFTTISGIWETITSTWNNIVTSVNELLNEFLTNTTAVFNNIWNGITATINNIYNTIVSGLNNAVSFILNLVSEAWSWGSDFVGNFINGITSRMQALLQTVSNLASKIRSYLHFSEPDTGPLADFHEWMPDFMEGLANDIDKSRHLVQDAVSRVASDMVISPKMGVLDALGSSSGRASSSVNHTGTIRVEGVNDSNMLSNVVDIIIDQLRQEVRC